MRNLKQRSIVISIFYAIAAATALMVTFMLPSGMSSVEGMEGISWAEVFFAVSSLAFALCSFITMFVTMGEELDL